MGERIAHASGNSMVLGFPGSSAPTGQFYKPEVSVLAALLGGVSTIKWSPGFSLLANATKEAPNMHITTKCDIYSDAGLMTIEMSGSANDIRNTAGKVVEALKACAENISDEQFQKAKSVASVTVEQVKKVAKEALENKAAVSAVGDLY